MKNKNVLAIDRFQTRLFGNKIYVDVDIQVASDDTLLHAHCIAENVHDRIERDFPRSNILWFTSILQKMIKSSFFY